jgi:hypothetical protein
MSFTDFLPVDPSALPGDFTDVFETPVTGPLPYDPSTDELSLGVPTIAAPLAIQPSGAGVLADLSSLLHSATQPVVQFYADQAAIARAKGLTDIAKAQTANATQVARAGQPSPYVFLAAGLGALALVMMAGRR